MTEEAEWLGDEGVAAILGLVLTSHGGDFEISEEIVSLGLPEDSRVAVFWNENDKLVVGIRPNDWKPEDQ